MGRPPGVPEKSRSTAKSFAMDTVGRPPGNTSGNPGVPVTWGMGRSGAPKSGKPGLGRAGVLNSGEPGRSANAEDTSGVLGRGGRGVVGQAREGEGQGMAGGVELRREMCWGTGHVGQPGNRVGQCR